MGPGATKYCEPGPRISVTRARAEFRPGKCDFVAHARAWGRLSVAFRGLGPCLGVF